MRRATGLGCFQRQDAPAFDNHQWGLGAGVYLQDRWKPWKRLTILPGIRFDWGVTRNSVGQTVSNLFGFGPRLGGVWDLTGDSKTIFSAFYGRSNETLSLLAAVNADVSATVSTMQWNPATNKFELLDAVGRPRRLPHRQRTRPRRTPTRSRSASAARSSRTRSPASITPTSESPTSGTASR